MALRDSLKFEGAVKPDSITVDSYENDTSAMRSMNIPSNQQTLIDYLSGTNPIYIGTACRGFSTSDGTDNDSSKPNWLIKKITWDSNNNPTAIQIGWGKWDNRATITYS